MRRGCPPGAGRGSGGPAGPRTQRGARPELDRRRHGSGTTWGFEQRITSRQPIVPAIVPGPEVGQCGSLPLADRRFEAGLLVPGPVASPRPPINRRLISYTGRVVGTEDPLGLVDVVVSATERDVLHRGFTAKRVGHVGVVILDVAALRTSTPVGCDKGALPGVAAPDGARDVGRYVARSWSRRTARPWLRRGGE